MSSPNSTTSALRPRQANAGDLPPHDAQRHIRRSALEAGLRHKQHYSQASADGAHGQLPVLFGPVERQAGQKEQLAVPSRVLPMVPPEILNEIFAYLHRQYRFITLPVNQREFPWNVAGVCSQWRRVVWSMPGAFDTIAIGKPYGSPLLGPIQVQAVGYVLSHILSFGSAHTLMHMMVYPPFFGIPISYSHRIRELKLRSIGGEMLASLFQIPAGSFDHLEELDVKVDDGTWIVFPTRSVQVMPALQALYVDSDQEHFLRPTLSLPWTQLIELKVTDALDTHNILDILSHLPHLVCCTFQICEEAGINTYPPLTLPHLTFMSLSHEYPFDVASFLDPLTLPSLEELCMTDDGLGHDTLGTWSHQPFTALINRSQCLIRDLVLEPNVWTRVSLVEDSIEPLLRALPAVKTLELPALVPSSTFTEIHQNGLLPQLEHVQWILDAAGVEEYIDWLSSFEAGGGHRLGIVKAFCHVGRRFVAAEKRFCVRKAEISRAGIDAELYRAGQDQDGSCECEDPDTDESEGDEDGDSYCPWR